MADEKIALSININSGDAEKTVGELKDEFKSLLQTIQQTTVGSEEYLKAMARLGEVKGDLKDLKEDMNALNPENRVQPWINLTSGIANGFAAAQGAMALFGGESEAVQQSILKVQAAMAIGSGIQNIIQLGDTFRVLKAQIMASKVAQKELNFAMSANPVVLFTSAIAALAGAFYFLTEKQDDNTKAVLRNAESQKKYNDELKGTIELLDKAGDVFDKSKLNAEKQQQNLAVLRGQLTQYEADRINATKEYNEKLLKLEHEFDTKKKEFRAAGNITDEQFASVVENETKKKLKDEYDKTIAIINEKENQAQVEKRRARNKDLEDVESRGLHAIKVEKEKSEEIKKVTEVNLSELQGLRNEADQRYILDTEEKYMVLTSLGNSFAQGSAALFELMGQQGDEFNSAQKAIAFVQIGIDTAKAISGAIANAQSVPFPFNIAAAATGVASVLANIAQARRILEGSNKGSRPSISTSIASTGGGGGLSTQPQGLKQVNQNTTNLQGFKDSSGEQGQQQIIKAYVVESEITDSQKAVASIQKKAKF